MNVLAYEFIYLIVQFLNVPISRVFGSHEELKKIIPSVAGPPGTVLELGCGDGRDAIFLAKNGFDVTAMDFSPTAIKMANKNVEEAGLDVKFIQDDLTDLDLVTGTFDLVVDIGAFNDLSQTARGLYMENVLPLTHLGPRYFLMCFMKKLSPRELDRRFDRHFKIEHLKGDKENPISPGIDLYSMVRIQ